MRPGIQEAIAKREGLSVTELRCGVLSVAIAGIVANFAKLY